MANKILLTDNATYRKASKMLCTLDGVYRKVKKGLITVGGVYRLFFKSGGSLSYYGQLSTLSNEYLRVAVSTPTHALFGHSGSNTPTKAIDVFDKSLTKSTINLSDQRLNLIGASVGEYGLFGGGKRVWEGSSMKTVFAFDTTLTEHQPASLSTGGKGMSGKNHAFFLGTNGNAGDAYDANLTKYTITAATNQYAYDIGGVVGDYSIAFDKYSSSITAYVAYDSSLTRFIPPTVSAVHQQGGGGSTGKHCLIAGGKGCSVVEGYDSSLTLISAPSFNSGRNMFFTASTASIEELAVFPFGVKHATSNNYKYATTEVEIFDDSLTKTIDTSFTGSARSSVVANKVGEYLLFTGGTPINSGWIRETQAYKYQ